MAKLVVASMEKAVVKLIATAPPKIAHFALASLRAEHFAYPPTLEAFKRLALVAKKEDQVLTWEELTVDNHISESSRDILAAYTKRSEHTKERVTKYVAVLDRYRKMRISFYSANDVLLRLKAEKIDIDQIIADQHDSLSKAKATSAEVATVVHYGEGNNSTYLIKDMLEGKTKPAIPTGIKAFDDINVGLFYGSMMVLAGTSGGGKCIRGDSLVPTTNGLLTLKEIYNNKGTHFAQGFYYASGKVLTHEGTINNIHSVYKTKGKTWKIKTQVGDEIEGLPEHKIYTLKNSELEFKRLDCIESGDWIVKSVNNNTFPLVSAKLPDFTYYYPANTANKHRINCIYPSHMTESFAHVLGLVVSEGDTRGRVTQHNKRVMGTLIDAIHATFGYENNCVKVYNIPKPINSFIELIAGQVKSSKRFVPLHVRQSPKNIQAAFLRALFEGGASIWKDTSAGVTYCIEYTTISKTLVYQVKAMLENFGINCDVQSFNTWATNGSKNQISKKGWKLYVQTYSIPKFKDDIGFISKKKTNRLDKAVKNINKPKMQDTNQYVSGWHNQTPGKDVALTLFDSVDRAVKGLYQVFDRKTPYGTMGTHRRAACAGSIFGPIRTSLKTQHVLNKYTLTSILDAIDACDGLLKSAITSDSACLQAITTLNMMKSNVWVKVSYSKATNKSKTVYDISVPGPKSYSVNGIMSHNSVIALTLAKNMATYGAKVCFIPLEQDEQETNQRLMANVAEIDMTKMINPKLLTSSDKTKLKRRFKDFVERMKKIRARLTVWKPTEDMTLDDMFFHLKPMGYNVIIVDYLGLTKGVGGDDAWQKLGEAARSAKMFASLNNCVVILLAQLNDDMSVRYSRAVTEHASNAWHWVRDKLAMDTHLINIVQRKSRNQRGHNFQLLEEFQFMRVRDVPEGYTPVESQQQVPGNKINRQKSIDKGDYFSDVKKKQ